MDINGAEAAGDNNVPTGGAWPASCAAIEVNFSCGRFSLHLFARRASRYGELSGSIDLRRVPNHCHVATYVITSSQLLECLDHGCRLECEL